MPNARQNRLYPILRFPDFNNAWEPTTLISISRGALTNGVFNDPKLVGKGYRLINVKDMYVGSRINPENLTLVNIPKFEFDRNKVEHGDIFFTRSSLVKEGIAYSNVYLDSATDVTYDGHLIRMRPNKSIVDSLCLAYHLKMSTIRKQLVSRGKTTTMTTIGQADIAPVLLNTTSLAEQQKIAAFLSAVDKKIQLLQRKKELLEQYKKGVMQKIFSQEIRFKDEGGNDYPDWEEKRLGDLIEEHRGGASLSPSDFVKTPGFEVIPKKSVSKGGVLKLDTENPTFCNESFFTKNEMNVIDDSFVITTLRDLVPSGPNIGYVVKYRGESRYILAQGVYAFKIDSSVSIPDFLIQFSNTSFYRKIMQEIMVGSTQVHIRNSDYFKILISLPSIAEQMRITAFLNTLDHKIEALRLEYNENHSFKKGLLQQMFV
jgi:type I restriction enzyme, S subunit